MFRKVLKYLNYHSIQEDDKPDIEPHVDEDLDLWELLNAYIFGEQDDDDDNMNEKSKSSSAADRDSNGHTYKATKRKLLSVEEDQSNIGDSSHVHHGHSHSHNSRSQGKKNTVEEATEGDVNIEVVQEETETTSQKETKDSDAFSSFFNAVMKIIDDLLLYW